MSTRKNESEGANLVRLNFKTTPEERDELEKFQKENHYLTLSEAIRQLLRKGLSASKLKD